jgi:dipeptidyl-peptidase-4
MASCHRLSFAIAIAASFIAPWLTPLAADAQAQTQAPARAQAAKALTLDALYHPDKKVDFTAGGRALPIWLDDSSYILQPMRPGAGGGAGAGGDDGKIVKVDAATGATSVWFDNAKLAAAIAKVPGLTADDAKRAARVRLASFNAARSGLMVTIADDLFYYEVAGDRLTRLTNTPGVEEFPAFSPDGRLISFVRDFNIYVVDVATGAERALTTDGSATLLNGKLDWVYQEEVYGRGTFQAVWWSPDSTRLAFLQLNESPVAAFTVVDHEPYRQGLEVYPYPKSGDPNPTVKLGVVRVAGGSSSWINTEGYGGGEFLIVNVGWTPDSRSVAYQVQDREQTWLDLNVAPYATREPTRLLRETSKAWVNVLDPPKWLKDGSFIWSSERSGFEHLYHYKADGTLIRQITDGKWEARTLHGVDEAGGWVYFSGTERSAIGSDVYRVKLDGSGLTRLSQKPGSETNTKAGGGAGVATAAGTHSAKFSPSFTYYVDDWSDAATPTQQRLHRASDGVEVRALDEGKIPTLAEYQGRLSKPEFLQVKARDGFVMEAMLIKPPDFDPAKKYPVFQTLYAGPHAQTVRDAWGGVGGLYLQLLAQKGVIVWECDNRSASGKGVESTFAVYQHFGRSEADDIEDCVSWLKKQPYVDATRIGVNGWSFGGFMTSYLLTHSKSFAMGIAGGTVSDWRDYDSIYTERYMRMPQNNPDGYRTSSPRWSAKDLSGKLLLIHGVIDDNVHVQNTLQFVYELQKAGKPFDLMLYPKSRHGVGDPQLVYHMRQLMLAFTLRTLTPAGAGAAVAGPQPTASAAR